MCSRRGGAQGPDLAHHCFRVAGWETSRNPGSQQGSWFPASLTGKTFEDQDFGWHIATTALPCPCCPDRSCTTAERRSTRLVPRPVADGRRRRPGGETHKSPHVADARVSLTPRGMGPLISRLKAGRARVSRLPGQPYKSGDEGLQSGKTR